LHQNSCCLPATTTLSACGLLSSRGSIASLALRSARRSCLRLTHVVASMRPRLDSRWGGSFPFPVREFRPLEASGFPDAPWWRSKALCKSPSSLSWRSSRPGCSALPHLEDIFREEIVPKLRQVEVLTARRRCLAEGAKVERPPCTNQRGGAEC
jgi:hypothetical protein